MHYITLIRNLYVKLTLSHRICSYPWSGNYTVGFGSQIRHPSNLSQGLNYRLPQHTHSKSEQNQLISNLKRRTYALIAQCNKGLIDNNDDGD